MSQSYAEKPDPRVHEADQVPRREPAGNGRAHRAEREAPAESSDWMKRISADSATADQDLAYGQPAIVAVRWLMIISGLVLAILNVTDLNELRLSLIVIFLLALTNFYLQAQLLTKKPVMRKPWTALQESWARSPYTSIRTGSMSPQYRDQRMTLSGRWARSAREASLSSRPSALLWILSGQCWKTGTMRCSRRIHRR